MSKLIAEKVVEVYASPYASPVVLLPGPSGTFRLRIDYRRLNASIAEDSYPLPRMNLLNETKDLLMRVLNIYIFGLRYAYATFRRLINCFQNGLEDILYLTYLDDFMIV
ncbi:hypothetical protein CEXT_495761 [Caerostris extrusa]|uniref:Reverse transcriptase n=1 Tax=Caerostris extrusa TaxID=172846 RepID=A0AAV4RUL8_CAEEX|nr:hypothetical protein CEXT_495761 [Caerostris extrusa]